MGINDGHKPGGFETRRNFNIPPVVPLMKEGGKEAEVGQGDKQKRK